MLRFEGAQKSMRYAPVQRRSVISITEGLMPLWKQSVIVMLFASSIFLYGLAHILPSVPLTLDYDPSASFALGLISIALLLLPAHGTLQQGSERLK